MLASLKPFQDKAFDAARSGSQRERSECYAADGLVAMAAAASGAPADDRGPAVPATVIALIDHAALVRGYVEGDECSVIDGVGPVPVTTVRDMMTDAFLAAVVRDGVDIRSVVHLGRQVTARQRTALIARDRTCVIPGCDVTHGLEIDHVEGWAVTRVTTLDQVARECAHHHYQKTYEGWALTGRPGAWQWHPPPPGPFDDDGLDLVPPPSGLPPPALPPPA